MTHIENIPHILRHGITHRNSPNANPDYITIGDKCLIATRRTLEVQIENGGTIILGDFIPFYFGIKMPMLTVVQHGWHFVEKATPPKDIVYLACAITKIIESDKTYFFSDGHVTDTLTKFYDKSQIKNLPDILNWTAIKSRYWAGEENLMLKNKKQAEFFVEKDLSPDYITGFLCYDEQSKQILVDKGVDGEKITVQPRAYYHME
jgi:hypothetical protein